MAQSYTTKYILTSTGSTYSDFNLQYGSVSLQSEAISYVGTGNVDGIFVHPGDSINATNTGAGQDQIYLEGTWASYVNSITLNSATSTMTLSKGSGATLEQVSFQKTGSGTSGAAASDLLVFSDGAINTLDIYNALNSAAVRNGTQTAAAALGALTLNTAINSLNPPLLTHSNTVTYAASGINNTGPTNVGDTFVTAGVNTNTTVVGSTGIDTVYVKAGSTVDLTRLGSRATDVVYMTGNWADYTKSLSSATGTITFTRSVTVNGQAGTETIKLKQGTVNGAGVVTGYAEQLVFADGSVMNYNAKAALAVSLTTPITSVDRKSVV